MVAFHIYLSFINILVIDTMFHIKHQPLKFIFWICATHHTNAVTRSQLNFHTIIQNHGIITRLGIFILVFKGCVTIKRIIVGISFVCHIAVKHKLFRKRHKPKITIIRAARAAEVGGAEAEDGVVGGVVARGC